MRGVASVSSGHSAAVYVSMLYLRWGDYPIRGAVLRNRLTQIESVVLFIFGVCGRSDQG